MAKMVPLVLTLYVTAALASPLVKRQSAAPAQTSAAAATSTVAATSTPFAQPVQAGVVNSTPAPQATAGTFIAGTSTYTAIQHTDTSTGVFIDCTFLSVSGGLTISEQTISMSSTDLLQIASGTTSTISLSTTDVTIATTCTSTSTITYTQPSSKAAEPTPSTSDTVFDEQAQNTLSSSGSLSTNLNVQNAVVQGSTTGSNTVEQPSGAVSASAASATESATTSLALEQAAVVNNSTSPSATSTSSSLTLEQAGVVNNATSLSATTTGSLEQKAPVQSNGTSPSSPSVTPSLQEDGVNNTQTFNGSRKAAVSNTYSGSWTTVQCDAPGTTSAFDNQDPTTAAARWTAAQADSAWKNLVDNWNVFRSQNPTSTWTFTLFMYDFFHDEDDSDCGEPSGPCPVAKCDSNTHPAGFLIINSIHNIWQAFSTFQKALQDSIINNNGQMVEFQEAFVPIPDLNNDVLNIVLSIVGFVAGIAGAGFWNKVKPQISSNADFYKDAVNSIIGNTITTSGRFLSVQGLSASGVIDSYTDFETHIWDGARGSANATLKGLMSGFDATNLTNLGGLIADGGMLGVNPSLQDNLNVVASQTLWGGLMRLAWTTTGEDGGQNMPYVLYVPRSVYQCGSDPSSASPIPGDTYTLEALISGDDMVNNGPMWCDFQGNSWFLLNAFGTTLAGGNNANLDGSKWAGITLEQITQSAWDGYVANNQVNPVPLAVNNGDYLGTWGDLSNTAGAPGFFNFPMCSSVDAIVNAQTGRTENQNDDYKTVPGWPCPGDGGLANSLNNTTSVALGSCGLHFRITHADNDQRLVDISVKSGDGQTVGTVTQVNATPPNKPAPIQGALPGYVTYIIPEAATGENVDTIQFSYVGVDRTQSWSSTDGNCQVGAFDGSGDQGGTVDGDCGFDC